MEYPVSAKHSLWFCWAEVRADLNGPEGEGEQAGETGLEDYKPFPICGFEEGDQLEVKIRKGQTWSHHSGHTSGPQGEAGTARGLENGAYQNAIYNSQNIQDNLSVDLNTMVYMWELNCDAPDGTGSNGMQYSLGDSLVQHPTQEDYLIVEPPLVVPEGATKLFFGFYDGRHWTNNSGAIDISIQIL